MKPCLLPGMIVVAVASLSVGAAEAGDSDVAQLRSMVDSLRGEVDQLRGQMQSDWLTEQRSEQIRGLVEDVLADADTRANLQGDGATSGYDGGFFIQSADGRFRLKVSGQLQARFMYNNADGQNSDYGFEMRRLKLKFSGHVVDPTWTYKFSIINQRNSQGTGAENEMYVEDAWIQKTCEDGCYVRVGQFKAPFLREELVSSSKQLTVERSMINNQFTYGWTQGVELGMKKDNLWARAMYLDGPVSINSQSQNTANDAASLVARVDWMIDGVWKDWSTFTGYGSKSESSAFIGAAFQWFNNSDRASATPTEYGGADANRSYGFTVDASVSGKGWTAYSALVYSNNAYDGPVRFTPAGVPIFGNVDSNQAWGWIVQGGVMVADEWQVFGRYELGDIQHYNQGNAGYADGNGLNNRGMRTGHDSTLTVGFNNWIEGKNLKWTTDVGYAFSTLNDGGSDMPRADYVSSGNGWREDNAGESGQWLIRTQLQLLF